MAKEFKSIGASVRARLLQLAKASGQSFDLVLTRFALERLLFRLSQSPHADRGFAGDRLARAIAATFARRETAIPVDLPDALTPAFASDEQKQRQWNAFTKDVFANPGSLENVVASLAEFLMPHAIQARASNKIVRRGKLGISL
ncbi:hypothetical protein [Bradyrhizobium elkanii]|jgi:hypothetical protein|uniref:hypothetical protein n=1 Tax=Bradyrhizobium elkanii TaxID=29448 RepID=UPI00209FF582|nr:hypothetical protein [Bradyrhizobium elkanii]MCP1931083.1 hypothetical protein [Bradyrhizobium elkanii]